MKTNPGRRRDGLVCLSVACLGLLPPEPLPAQEPQPRAIIKAHAAAVCAVAFSPDGKTLASGSLDNTIKLWDVQTGKEQATFTGHLYRVNPVVFSPDGKTLALGSEDMTIRLWEMSLPK